MGKPKRSTAPRIAPNAMPRPSEASVHLYFALRAEGILLWRDGAQLRVAFPNLAGIDGDQATVQRMADMQARYRMLIEERWTGLFEVVCAIEARNRILFEWLTPRPVAPEDTRYTVAVMREPVEALPTFLGALSDPAEARLAK